LNNAFDDLFPYKVKRPNGLRYKRFARLAWLSFAMGTDITTSKDLTAGEVWRILNWLNGLNPATGEPPIEIDQSEAVLQRKSEVTLWLVQHHEQIMTTVTRAKELLIAKRSGGKRSAKSSPNTASTSLTTNKRTQGEETSDG
jgi:hypothetical protein